MTESLFSKTIFGTLYSISKRTFSAVASEALFLMVDSSLIRR